MTVNFLPVSTCHFHFILQNAQPLVFHSNMKEANPQRGCKISNWITWPTRPASRYFQFAARRLISVTTSAQILFQSFSNPKAKKSVTSNKKRAQFVAFKNLKKLINAKRKRAKENQPLTTRDQCKASSSSSCCSYCRYKHQFHITSQSQPHDDCWSGESKRERKTSETSSYESGWQWIKHGDLNRKWRRRRLPAAAVW